MSAAFCPICYEAVDVVSQNLDSIAGCGHVFHELCLQQWVEYSPVRPQCPLCKANCGPGEYHRLYFQSSTEVTQQQRAPSSPRSLPTASELSGVDRDHVLRLEAKVQMLKLSQESSRKQLLDFQAAEESYKSKLSHLEAETTKAKEQNCIAHSKLRKALQELDHIRRECNRLVNRTSTLERDIAANKLVDDVDLSEDEMLNYTTVSAGHSQSKDGYIQVLAKALVIRNKAFKDLMTTCNELGIKESNAQRESLKLRAKVETLQARLKDLTNAQEQSHSAMLRSLSDEKENRDFGAERSRRPVKALAKVSSNNPRFGLSVETSNPMKTDLNESVETAMVEDFACNRIGRPMEVDKSDTDPFTEHLTDLRHPSTKMCTTALEHTAVSGGTSYLEKSVNFDTTENDIGDLSPIELDFLPIPIRKERNSSLVEESYSDNASILTLRETARTLGRAPENARFIISGPNGRGGRAHITPPPAFIVPPSNKGGSSGRQTKRPKVSTQVLKMEHFFGRN